jgi:hypothetical protein
MIQSHELYASPSLVVKTGLVGKIIEIEGFGVAKVLKFNRVKTGWGKHQVQFKETHETKSIRLLRDDNRGKAFEIVEEIQPQDSADGDDEVGKSDQNPGLVTYSCVFCRVFCCVVCLALANGIRDPKHASCNKFGVRADAGDTPAFDG